MVLFFHAVCILTLTCHLYKTCPYREVGASDHTQRHYHMHFLAHYDNNIRFELLHKLSIEYFMRAEEILKHFVFCSVFLQELFIPLTVCQCMREFFFTKLSQEKSRAKWRWCNSIFCIITSLRHHYVLLLLFIQSKLSYIIYCTVNLHYWLITCIIVLLKCLLVWFSVESCSFSYSMPVNIVSTQSWVLLRRFLHLE